MVRSLQTVLVIRVSFSFIAVPLLQQFTPPNIVLNHFMAEVIVFLTLLSLQTGQYQSSEDIVAVSET